MIDTIEVKLIKVICLCKKIERNYVEYICVDVCFFLKILTPIVICV